MRAARRRSRSGRSRRWRRSARAASRRAATGSAAMMRAAPATRAPCTMREADAAEPHHQHGRARLDARGVQHRARRRSARRSRSRTRRRAGRLVATLTAPAAGTSTYSANAPRPTPRKTISSPPREPGGAVVERVGRDHARVHAHAGLAAHAPVAGAARRHRRQDDGIARRRGHRPRGPIASTTPAASWPRMIGVGGGEDAVGDAQVGVADAAVSHAHAHLPRPRGPRW